MNLLSRSNFEDDLDSERILMMRAGFFTNQQLRGLEQGRQRRLWIGCIDPLHQLSVERMAKLS
jgi:hypothetical protein